MCIVHVIVRFLLLFLLDCHYFALQDKLTSLLLQAGAMSDLLLALRDLERGYMQRHLTDICSMTTSQEAVLYFCQVIEVRFESTMVAITQLILKTAKTVCKIYVYSELPVEIKTNKNNPEENKTSSYEFLCTYCEDGQCHIVVCPKVSFLLFHRNVWS